MDRITGTAGGQAPPPDAAVLEALARVLSSTVVSRAARTSAFLEYVVVETVAGRSGRLKERVIGRRALDVPPTYDSRLDPSVRVRAARVRRALQAYYAGEGLHDPVLIEIPRGTYVPQFRWRTPGHTEMPPGPTTLRVAVPAVPGLPPDEAAVLRERLVRSLRAYPSLEVLGDEDAGAARYRLDVTAGTDANQTWSVAVIDTVLGSLVWEDTAGPRHEEIDEMVAWMPATIGEYGGLIPRRAVEESVDSTGGLAAHATLQFFRHTESQSIEQLLDAIVALDAAVAQIDDNVLLLSYAAAAKAELVLSGGAAAEPALSGADAHISRARDIDVNHPAPVLSQAMVSLARGRAGDAVAGVGSILVHPALDPSLGFAAGVILAAAGEVDEGTALVRAFDRSHAASAGYQHVYLTIERLQSGDAYGAMAHAALIPLVAEVRPLLHAVVLDAVDRRPHALAVLERLPSRDMVRVDHWASVLARSWDIPPSWRDALIARVTDLLSPAAG